MKVHNNTIFMGDASRSERHEKLQNGQKKSGSTIFAGSLNGNFDPIAQKKKQAQKQAMKIVSDTWTGDRKIDDDLEERRNKIIRLQEEKGLYNKELKAIEDARAELREAYGVEEDSREEKDLRLLEKEIDARTPGKEVYLTKEEKDRIEELKAAGLTEYQSRSLDMKEQGAYYEGEIYNCDKEIKQEREVISSIRLERLKKNPMLEAQNQAEDIMEAASKEIIGMLMDEAKDHIDEELEEKKEAAKEKAEEEKELEEKLEKIKKEKKEQEELTEEILEAAEQTAEPGSMQNDALQDIKDMIDKMKLLEEDIKGAAVDEKL